MKILFLLNAYQDDGPGRLIYAVVKRLSREKDITCWTAALRRSGPLKERFEGLAVPTKVIKMKHIYQRKRFQELVDFIRGGEFNIVHTNIIRTDIIGRYAARKAGVPIILSTEHGIHTWGVKGPLVGSITKHLYLKTTRFTDRIIAVSNFVKESLLKAGVPEKKIATIHNGVDLEKFSPSTDDERNEFVRYFSDEPVNHVVGGVGNLVTLKGHSYFIRAIPQILKTHPGCLFVFVGEGPLDKKLRAEVDRLGLSDKVRFLGRLSTITGKVISSMEVLVQPSLTESFGLAVAEGLACGVPVVASRVGGLPELVKDGQHGFLVEPKSPEAIAERVLWLLDNKEEAEKMGQQGREFVSEHFDINTTVQKYLDLYRDLIEHKDVETTNQEEENPFRG
jgi:glycosyltransferase involved in cell wall biosynthesis